MSKIPAEEKSSSSNSPSLRIPNKSEQDTDKLDGDEQIQQLLKDYEEQFAATKETEGSLMSTIAQQREQIAQLQNQVQSNELEKKRLTDEIYFLRQKEYIIEQEAQVGQKSAHEEAKKSPKSASRPKDENKKGPSLRGDKKPAQESAPKTKSPDEKKTAAPSASKKPELAPKTQSTGQNKNDPTPEENKVESSQKATNINKKATSSPEEAKKAKPMPKDQKNVEAKSSSPTETKKRSKTPSKPADQAAKTPAPSEEVQPLKSEPTNSSQNEEIMDTQAVEPVKTAKVPAFKGSKPKQQPEVKKPELAKPAPEAPPQTLESSSPPTESTLETKPEKPTKNSPSIMPEEEKEVKPQITQPKTSSPGGSIFTRIQPNLFRFEVLPFLSHPREVAVLRCVDRQHSSMMNDRAQGIIAHFEQILYEMSKGMSEERMQETERVLQQAKDALNVVNKGDITELKSFLKPPVGAIQVAEVIVLLLTGNLKPDWASFKKLASDKSFIPRLINLDIPNIPKRAIQKCRQYLRAANYNPAAVRGVSAACASLWQWSQAVIHFYSTHSPDVEKMKKIKESQASFARALDPLRKATNQPKEPKKASPESQKSTKEENKASPQSQPSTKEEKKLGPQLKKGPPLKKQEEQQLKKSESAPKPPARKDNKPKPAEVAEEAKSKGPALKSSSGNPKQNPEITSGTIKLKQVTNEEPNVQKATEEVKSKPALKSAAQAKNVKPNQEKLPEEAKVKPAGSNSKSPEKKQGPALKNSASARAVVSPRTASAGVVSPTANPSSQGEARRASPGMRNSQTMRQVISPRTNSGGKTFEPVFKKK